MSYTEANSVEQMILDTIAFGGGKAVKPMKDAPAGSGQSLGDQLPPLNWDYRTATQIPRKPAEVMVEPWVREALIRLNPEIKAQPDRADEVIYALRAILLSVQADGLVRANENFMAWMRGEKTMPFGPRSFAAIPFFGRSSVSLVVPGPNWQTHAKPRRPTP